MDHLSGSYRGLVLAAPTGGPLLVVAAGVVVVLAVLLVAIMVMKSGGGRRTSRGIGYDAQQGPIGQPQAPAGQAEYGPRAGGRAQPSWDGGYGPGAQAPGGAAAAGWGAPFAEQQAAGRGPGQWGGPQGGAQPGWDAGAGGAQMGWGEPAQPAPGWGAAAPPAPEAWGAPAAWGQGQPAPAAPSRPQAAAQGWENGMPGGAAGWGGAQPSQPSWGQADQPTPAWGPPGAAPARPWEAQANPAAAQGWGAQPPAQEWGAQPPAQEWGAPAAPSTPGYADADRTRVARPAAGQRSGVIVVRQGKEPGRTFDLRKERVTIGRSRDNDVFLDDPAVSRLHTSISLDPSGQYLLRDEGSANGTYVNGQKVPEAVLQEGDEIQVGQTVLAFIRR